MRKQQQQQLVIENDATGATINGIHLRRSRRTSKTEPESQKHIAQHSVCVCMRVCAWCLPVCVCARVLKHF